MTAGCERARLLKALARRTRPPAHSCPVCAIAPTLHLARVLLALPRQRGGQLERAHRRRERGVVEEGHRDALAARGEDAVRRCGSNAIGV